MITKSPLFPDSSRMSYSFGLASERHLQVDKGYSPISAWRALSHHIVRYPRDLRAHTQRILLGYNNNEIANFLPGSLQDLFLVLDNNGYPLRKHLLDLSEQYLTNDEFSFFSHWIKQNSKNDKTHHCWQNGSVLSSGSCGGKPLLRQEESGETEAVAAYSDVLEEARACLDYGQLDVAQQLLEDEILKFPQSKEIEKELLTIYQYSRDKEQFDNLTKKLLEQGVTLSEEWKECQQNSSTWSEK
ncbi:MAG: hypothetical protein KAH03_08290 [Cocleimonas sp.]|nr:hypothetical protein [Cocleimonas sp.]